MSERENATLRVENKMLRRIIEDAIPWIASHPRDSAQLALSEMCAVVGSDPFDWTSHPDVLLRVTTDRRGTV